jgi:hypothetical protein
MLTPPVDRLDQTDPLRLNSTTHAVVSQPIFKRRVIFRDAAGNGRLVVHDAAGIGGIADHDAAGIGRGSMRTAPGIGRDRCASRGGWVDTHPCGTAPRIEQPVGVWDVAGIDRRRVAAWRRNARIITR